MFAVSSRMFPRRRQRLPPAGSSAITENIFPRKVVLQTTMSEKGSVTVLVTMELRFARRKTVSGRDDDDQERGIYGGGQKVCRFKLRAGDLMAGKRGRAWHPRHTRVRVGVRRKKGRCRGNRWPPPGWGGTLGFSAVEPDVRGNRGQRSSWSISASPKGRRTVGAPTGPSSGPTVKGQDSS